MMDMADSPTSAKAPWLLRVPEVFGGWRDEVLCGLGTELVRPLGKEYLLTKCDGGPDGDEALKFVTWKLRVGHAWPCNPRKQDGFVEKAAQALAAKFAGCEWQALLVGALDSGDRYFRSLASNLRGRSLQLVGGRGDRIRDAADQDPAVPSLFVLVGREGLFAGISTPAEAGGFYPGGTRFIRQSGEQSVSRAGAKIAEALHFLPLAGGRVAAGGHWLELGASPGGMTAELLDRGFLVTAVDRAPLDRRLDGRAGLRVVQADVRDFHPPKGVGYEAILSDMNGDAVAAFGQVLRLTRWLRPGGIVVFTLKLAGVEAYPAVNHLASEVVAMARRAGLELRMCRHLTYNRMEFTCIFEHQGLPV